MHGTNWLHSCAQARQHEGPIVAKQSMLAKEGTAKRVVTIHRVTCVSICTCCSAGRPSSPPSDDASHSHGTSHVPLCYPTFVAHHTPHALSTVWTSPPTPMCFALPFTRESHTQLTAGWEWSVTGPRVLHLTLYDERLLPRVPPPHPHVSLTRFTRCHTREQAPCA